MNGMRLNALLLEDFYKACHNQMYNKKVAKMTSYLTPRSSRFPNQDWVMFFGLRMFVQKYLIEEFTKNFFELSWTEIEAQHIEVLTKSLGYSEKEYRPILERIKAFHELGYLPIKIRALPEGSKVPMGVPCVEISVTDSRFPWVGQAIECVLSCSMWHPMVSATVAYRYRELAHEFAKKSSDVMDGTTTMCDFSLRGQESMESACASSAGWCVPMRNSSTVPTRALILGCYPQTDNEKLKIGCLTSTEHSVMCTDYAITHDERETYRRLLTETYPDVSFAAVSDSYDYWHVLTEILPSLRPEIEAHKGFIGVRHDSAEPVEALCGIPQIVIERPAAPDPKGDYKDLYEKAISACGDCFAEYQGSGPKFGEEFKVFVILTDKEHPYPNLGNQYLGKIVTGKYAIDRSDGISYKITNIETRERTWEEKGMIETIWEIFGGKINSKGYRVNNPRVKAVYGDSITLERAQKIFERMEAKKFAIDNISLGVGSFSMQAVEWGDKLYPFTRDTFSIAIKCTWAELTDGTRIPVFKDPKNFSGKKSQKGLCLVYKDKETGKYAYKDGFLNPEEVENDPDNAFVTYYMNTDNMRYNGGETDFNAIRARVDEYFK